MRMPRLSAIDNLMRKLPVGEGAVLTNLASVAEPIAMRLTPAALDNEIVPLNAIRGVLGAIRYGGASIRLLPMQPFLAALVASFLLGAIPMMLTALFSVARTVWDWYRHTPHRRRYRRLLVGTQRGLTADRLTFLRHRLGLREGAAVDDVSGNATPFNELLECTELL
jgi:hypothetical protein